MRKGSLTSLLLYWVEKRSDFYNGSAKILWHLFHFRNACRIASLHRTHSLQCHTTASLKAGQLLCKQCLLLLHLTLACYIYTEHWQSDFVQYKGYFYCFEFHTVCKQHLQGDLIVISTVCKCSKTTPGLRVQGATMLPQVPKVCICAVRDVIES